MGGSFNKLFWGFLIVILDFRFFSFDIFIDTVGYFIVVSGLSALSAHSKSFEKAKYFAIVLALFSISTIVQNGTSIFLNQGLVPTNFFLGTLLYSSILGFLHLFVAFEIFRGMLEMAKQFNFQALSEKVIKRARFYIVFSIITLSLTPVVFNIIDSVGIYMLSGIGITSFVVELMFIFILREFRNLYHPV